MVIFTPISQPYQQHEEDKEHIGQEEDGSQDPVGLLNLVEVEISQNGPEQCEDGVGEGAEVLDLGSEQQVAQLCKCKEHDEEHDAETGDILGTTGEGAAQLSHGLVEANVLEKLDPGKEDADGHSVVVLLGPVAQDGEVCKLVRLGQEHLQFVRHHIIGVQVEEDTNSRDLDEKGGECTE